MNVLYITTMYPIPRFPQQGIFCHEQVKALQQLGARVTVVVPIPFYDRQVTVSRWDYEGVSVRYVRFFKLPGSRDFHRTGKALYRQLNRQLKLENFDIYHADAALPSGQAAMLAAKKYKKPLVVHGHGLDMFLDGSYAGSKNCQKIVAASREVFRAADAIAGVSQKVLDQVSARMDIGGKGFVVYNGVDTEKFRPREKAPSDQVILTSIGNLIPLKGHDYTLRAVKALIDKGHKNIRLKLIGRGPLEQQLKDLARELDLGEYVEFIGYIPYEDVAKQLEGSDLFLLPSWYEALGCVYLEAMACGVPAVGCWGNGIDEIIEDGVTGGLVENKNLDRLVEKLEQLLSGNLQQMGAAARKAVEEGYTWRHSAQSLLKLYQTLCPKETV